MNRGELGYRPRFFFGDFVLAFLTCTIESVFASVDKRGMTVRRNVELLVPGLVITELLVQ